MQEQGACVCGFRIQGIAHFLSVLLALCISGCATVETKIAWPSRSNYSEPYTFTAVPSYDEAAGNIKTLQDNVTIGKKMPGPTCTAIDVDKYTVSMKFEWTANTEMDASSTGYMLSGTRVSTMERNTTFTVPVKKEYTLVVPLKGIESVSLEKKGNFVQFYYETNTMVRIIVDTVPGAKMLADSILTLARRNKDVLQPSYGFVLFSELKPEAKERLKLDHGLVVGSVERGGPGDKAGLSPGDVILEINGKAVDSVDDYRQFVRSGKPWSVHVKSFERMGKGNDFAFIGERTEDITPVR